MVSLPNRNGTAPVPYGNRIVSQLQADPPRRTHLSLRQPALLTQLGITMEHRPPYGKWLRYYWDFCPKGSARNKFALLPFEGNRTFGSHHSSSSSFSSSAFSIECQLTVAFQPGKAENDDEDESKMPSYLCPSPKYDLEPRQCRVFHSLTGSCGSSIRLTSNTIRHIMRSPLL